jgi:regulator of nucleoside diphosphate kinase
MFHLNDAASAATRGPILSSNDATRLELIALSETGELRKKIFDKISSAQLVSGQDITPDVATIGSILRYQIDNARIERRTLSLPEVTRPNGQFISLLTPVGLALLGAQEGDELIVNLVDEATLKLRLHKVEFQPEAEVRRRSTLVPDNGPGAA